MEQGYEGFFVASLLKEGYFLLDLLSDLVNIALFHVDEVLDAVSSMFELNLDDINVLDV